MSEQTVRNVVILGSGVSGLTAAIYTSRANLSPLVLEGNAPGGQLSITTLVENFPGFPEGVQGPELVENIKKQAQKFGAEVTHGQLTAVDLSQRPFKLTIDDDKVVYTKSLIIGSGANARWLGLESEQKLIGHGVSSCATCDGFFFRGKEIAVIGGGDSAMEEANFLTNFASKVTIIHRREEFRASRIMLERAQKNPKIEFVTNAIVEEILGVENNAVRGIRLRDARDGSIREIALSGVFLGIGHDPNSGPFAGKLPMDRDGYIETDGFVRTTVEGVFACGDVADRRYRQAITAAGTGCMAALEVEKFLAEND